MKVVEEVPRVLAALYRVNCEDPGKMVPQHLFVEFWPFNRGLMTLPESAGYTGPWDGMHPFKTACGFGFGAIFQNF